MTKEKKEKANHKQELGSEQVRRMTKWLKGKIHDWRTVFATAELHGDEEMKDKAELSLHMLELSLNHLLEIDEEVRSERRDKSAAAKSTANTGLIEQRSDDVKDEGAGK